MSDETPPSVRSPAATLVVERTLGFILSRAVYVAARLGIADLLAQGPLAVDQLASRCGAHAPSLYRVLRALASAGIFTETEPGRFGLNEAGELLKTDAPRSLRNLALHYGGISFRAWEDVLYSVETGKPAFDHVYGTTVWDYLGQHPDEAAAFNGAMRQGAAARAEMLGRYPWKGTETVVDLAGGDGTLLIELLSRNPGLQGVVVDLPPVAAEARAHIEQAGLAERCTALPGDLRGDLPTDGDVYVLSIVLHDWADDQAAAILRNCRGAMPQHAVLLLIEIVMPAASNTPDLGILVDLHMLVEPGGRERTEPEWRAVLEAGGFRLAQVNPGQPWCLLEAAPYASSD